MSLSCGMNTSGPGGRRWEAGGGGGGRLVGIAPLFRTRTRDGRDGLMLLGSIEISDSLDLIVAQDAVESFAQVLLEALEADAGGDPALLDLHNIPKASPTLAALEAAAVRQGWTATRERPPPCPGIRLSGGWGSYFSSLQKKQ